MTDFRGNDEQGGFGNESPPERRERVRRVRDTQGNAVDTRRREQRQRRSFMPPIRPNVKDHMPPLPGLNSTFDGLTKWLETTTYDPARVRPGWQDWTPTLTNITQGNGTIDVARYIDMGNLVVFDFHFTLGSTSSIGTNIGISLPVTAFHGDGQPTGQVRFADATGSDAWGVVVANSTTTCLFRIYNSSSTYVSDSQVTSTVPFTWATSDEILAFAVYEAA